jgi:hypothetical protein
MFRSLLPAHRDGSAALPRLCARKRRRLVEARSGEAMSDRLLTAREVAEYLSLSSGALLRWTSDGKVPANKATMA